MRIVPKTVQQAVVDDLRQAILRGRFAAGARLNQSLIASEYGVSPIPVREALRQLESEGLVRSAPHRGSVVSSLSPEELEDLYEIRIVLESLATRLAIPQADNAVLDRLGSVLDQMDSEHDPSRWLDLNFEFHRALYASSNRPHLCSLIDTLRSNTERYLRIAARSVARLQSAQVEHRRILQAFRERDADGAAHALQEHLQQTLMSLVALLQPGREVNVQVGTRRVAVREEVETQQRKGAEG